MDLMDSETGEVLTQNKFFESQTLNMETGEIESGGTNDEIETHDTLRYVNRKSKFNVPKSYLIQPETKNESNKCSLTVQETFTLTSKRRVIDLKEEIFMGYNKFSHRLFLLPTLFLFPKLAAIYILVLELFLHFWAHKKNKKNKDPEIFFRSPLHSLTSQFCSICRETKDLQGLQKYHRQKFMATGF